MHHEEWSVDVRRHGMASLGTTCREYGVTRSGKVDSQLNNKIGIYLIPTI
jgi:hypothetical protein